MQFAERIHFIGIKGAGMSAMASLLYDWGNSVSGSDVETYFFTQAPLDERGIVIGSFHPQNVAEAGIVVHSAAYGPDHPERMEAARRRIPSYSYPEFVGLLTQNKPTISIAGSHGKTTTSSMLTAAWAAAGRRPTAIIGDGTGIAGAGAELILESCEYRRHFLHYRPQDLLITNVDFDHPDYFRDLADVQDAYRTFMSKTTGHIVICGDSEPAVNSVPAGSTALFYGFGGHNDYRATNITVEPTGTRFDAEYQGKVLTSVTLSVPGRHNVLNALGVLALAHQKGMDLALIAQGLQQFTGARRRFETERIGSGVLVDDYAHHPVEIAATIQSARERFPDRRLIACFQPHTYSRTQALFGEFATALSQADDVYLLEIFGSAREQGGTVSSRDLASAIGPRAHYTQRDELAKSAAELVQRGATVLLMGAGDINKLKDAIRITAAVTPAVHKR